MAHKSEVSAAEFKAIALEVKADGAGKIEGYASRFGEKDQGGDIVAKGAFSMSLQSGRKPKMLWQHDPSQPIGVWDEVAEDDTGLYVKGRLLMDVAKGKEVASLIGAGAIDGMSIGYRTVDADRADDGARVLKQLELWEVSLVTFPMLTSARVSAAKAAEEFDKGNTSLMKRIVEENLRDAGFSKARAVAASGAAVGKLVDMGEPRSSLDELAQYMRQFQTGLGEY
jgi:HK97 family phage prohead protease